MIIKVSIKKDVFVTDGMAARKVIQGVCRAGKVFYRPNFEWLSIGQVGVMLKLSTEGVFGLLTRYKKLIAIQFEDDLEDLRVHPDGIFKMYRKRIERFIKDSLIKTP